MKLGTQLQYQFVTTIDGNAMSGVIQPYGGSRALEVQRTDMMVFELGSGPRMLVGYFQNGAMLPHRVSEAPEETTSDDQVWSMVRRMTAEAGISPRKAVILLRSQFGVDKHGKWSDDGTLLLSVYAAPLNQALKLQSSLWTPAPMSTSETMPRLGNVEAGLVVNLTPSLVETAKPLIGSNTDVNSGGPTAGAAKWGDKTVAATFCQEAMQQADGEEFLSEFAGFLTTLFLMTGGAGVVMVAGLSEALTQRVLADDSFHREFAQPTYLGDSGFSSLKAVPLLFWNPPQDSPKGMTFHMVAAGSYCSTKS